VHSGTALWTNATDDMLDEGRSKGASCAVRSNPPRRSALPRPPSPCLPVQPRSPRAVRGQWAGTDGPLQYTGAARIASALHGADQRPETLALACTRRAQRTSCSSVSAPRSRTCRTWNAPCTTVVNAARLADWRKRSSSTCARSFRCAIAWEEGGRAMPLLRPGRVGECPRSLRSPYALSVSTTTEVSVVAAQTRGRPLRRPPRANGLI